MDIPPVITRLKEWKGGDLEGLLFLPAISFLVRVVFSAHLPVAPLLGDAAQYDEIAVNLSTDRGFAFAGAPTALRPPVYPWLLSVIYLAFGHDLAAIRIVQAFIDALTVLVVYLLGRRFFGRRIALIAAIIVAFQPALIMSSTLVLTETLYTLILVSTVYLFLTCQRELSMRYAIAGGALVGVGALCRPTGLGIPAVLWLGAIFCDQKARRLKLTAIATLAACLVILPWAVRNAIQFNAFIPTGNSSFGQVLWLGSYAPWDLKWQGWDVPPLNRLLHGLGPVENQEEIDKIFKREAIKNITSQPLTYANLCLRKIWHLWRPVPEERQPFGRASLFWSLRSYHVILVCLFLTGIFFGQKIAVRDALPILLVLYWTGIHALTYSLPRYLVPLLPIIAIYGAVGCTTVWGKMMRRFAQAVE